MERLSLKYVDAVKALETLKQIMNEEFSVIVRDAAIQRFEYTFEAVWKFCKAYLKEEEGIVVSTPKSVFRAIFSLGVLTEEETVRCLRMTDARNETVHTYKEAVSDMIYGQIPAYVLLMDALLMRLRERGRGFSDEKNF